MADISKLTAPEEGPIDPALAGLEPASMWRVFSDLARIPRETGNEAGVRTYARSYAKKRGWACEENEIGDVLIRVNTGAKGPVVAMQAHMDMVCVSKDGAPYDFAKEPIRLKREGDIIQAVSTSLGADNGIGVAFALALAEELKGPIEILLTVDEEGGFSGIQAVAAGWLKAKYLINIDSEEEGFFTIASAGGRDFIVRFAGDREASAPALDKLEVVMDGLKGGHSGVEIHRGRTNALKVLGEVFALAKAHGGAVYSMLGGTAPNVIPSACKGVVGVPAARASDFRKAVAVLQNKTLTEEDPVLRIELNAGSESRNPLTAAASDKLIKLLDQIPSGVIVPSKLDPTQPFVSNNLAMVKELPDGRFELTLMSRSPDGSELDKLSARYKDIAESNGGEIEPGKTVPGWKPNYDSPLLAKFQKKYREQYGKDGKVFEIHAGLECGALQGKYPDMDLISVGPDITGVHSPDEKVSIESTRRTYALVRDVIQDLHKA
jgi:dipeptidase D